jgi:hypothetical protein
MIIIFIVVIVVACAVIEVWTQSVSSIVPSERAARARRVPKCQVWYFPNSKKGKSKFLPRTPKLKKICWGRWNFAVPRWSWYKTKPALAPFFKNHKNKRLGTHYFAQKRHKTSQIKFKRNMAPTIAPKIGPTLRTGRGSAADAKDGSPAAEGGPAAAKQNLSSLLEPRWGEASRKPSPPRDG